MNDSLLFFEEMNNSSKIGFYEISKLPLNIIYYDINLTDKGNENSNNCTFFQMNIQGIFMDATILAYFN